MKQRFLLQSIVILTMIVSCASQTRQYSHERLFATLYVQQSAEYHAICRQIFRVAVERLSEALADPQWSAYPSQAGDLSLLPPAVILDIDETVLDNSLYFGQLIQHSADFDLKQWNRWVVRAKAPIVPGADEFITAAQKAGVTVFFVTNRDWRLEGYTRLNLQRLGIVLDPHNDTVLSLNEVPGWGNDKESRRAFIAQRYRILLSIGDNLSDFVSLDGLDTESRRKVVERHNHFWGTRWFVLPNPMYGLWLDAFTKDSPDRRAVLRRAYEAVHAAPVVTDEEMRSLMAQPIPEFPRQEDQSGSAQSTKEVSPHNDVYGTKTPPREKEDSGETTLSNP